MAVASEADTPAHRLSYMYIYTTICVHVCICTFVWHEGTVPPRWRQTAYIYIYISARVCVCVCNIRVLCINIYIYICINTYTYRSCGHKTLSILVIYFTNRKIYTISYAGLTRPWVANDANKTTTLIPSFHPFYVWRIWFHLLVKYFLWDVLIYVFSF